MESYPIEKVEVAFGEEDITLHKMPGRDTPYITTEGPWTLKLSKQDVGYREFSLDEDDNVEYGQPWGPDQITWDPCDEAEICGNCYFNNMHIEDSDKTVGALERTSTCHVVQGQVLSRGGCLMYFRQPGLGGRVADDRMTG